MLEDGISRRLVDTGRVNCLQRVQHVFKGTCPLLHTVPASHLGGASPNVFSNKHSAYDTKGLCTPLWKLAKSLKSASSWDVGDEASGTKPSFSMALKQRRPVSYSAGS